MNLIANIPAGKAGITVNGLHQWDYGRKLEIHDADLPSLVEVHFAYAGMKEAVVRSVSATNGVAIATIPDKCLEQNTPVFAWVYIIDGTAGFTTKTVVMPVEARIKPEPGATVPEEFSDKYTEFITAANNTLGQLKSGAIKAGHAVVADTALSIERALEADNASLLDGVALSSLRGTGTGYSYKDAFEKDANNLTTEGHWFTISSRNTPETHGFLDVCYFDGTNFSPDGKGKLQLVHQEFQGYNTYNTYIRFGYKYTSASAYTWVSWGQVTGPGTKISNADHATTADHAALLKASAQTVTIPQGANGIDLELDLNSVYIFRDNLGFAFTLYIGDTPSAESNTSRSNVNNYLSYQYGRLYMRASNDANSSNNVVLNYIKIATTA